ncbi:hypothetical protein L7F22_028052, partial [Adiantum nelumboides]|nr:hypothetical protein [Adiantum nelumboides]
MAKAQGLAASSHAGGKPDRGSLRRPGRVRGFGTEHGQGSFRQPRADAGGFGIEQAWGLREGGAGGAAMARQTRPDADAPGETGQARQ